MTLARVVGTVVSTKRSDEIPGARYLIVEPCDTSGRGVGGSLIALDSMGSGPEEIVLISQGSSARQTEMSDQRAVDAIIVGIVDQIDEANVVTYRK